MYCLRGPQGGSTGQAETKVLCGTKSHQKPCDNRVSLAEPRIGADLLTLLLLFPGRGEGGTAWLVSNPERKHRACSLTAVVQTAQDRLSSTSLLPGKRHLPPTLVVRDLVSAAPLPGALPRTTQGALLLVKNPLSASTLSERWLQGEGTSRAGREKLSEAPD